MQSDHEIAFPPPRQFQPLPERGLITAAGFDLALLKKMGPESTPVSSGLIGGLGRLLIWPDFFLAGPVLGAPMAVMVLETLLRRGAKEFIFTGLAGGLSLDFEPGDLICPDEGLSTEGTSAHYPAPLVPDEDLRATLIDQTGFEVKGGCIWSTDGIYRETAALVEARKKEGARFVDMECTALWAAARFRQVRLVSLVVVSDILDGLEHRPGFHLPKYKAGLKLAAELAWRTLKARRS